MQSIAVLGKQWVSWVAVKNNPFSFSTVTLFGALYPDDKQSAAGRVSGDPDRSHTAAFQCHRAASTEHRGKGRVCDRLLVCGENGWRSRGRLQLGAGSARGDGARCALGCVRRWGRSPGLKPWIDCTVVPWTKVKGKVLYHMKWVLISWRQLGIALWLHFLLLR